jgi:ribosomal protein L29
MTDVAELLARQAKWQKSLRDLSWPEKVRMMAKLRRDLIELRRQRPAPALQTPAKTHS